MIFYLSSSLFTYIREVVAVNVEISIPTKNIDNPAEIPLSLLLILNSFINSNKGRSHIYYYSEKQDEIWRWQVIDKRIQNLDIFGRTQSNRRKIMYDCLQKHYLKQKPMLTIKLYDRLYTK